MVAEQQRDGGRGRRGPEPAAHHGGRRGHAGHAGPPPAQLREPRLHVHRPVSVNINNTSVVLHISLLYIQADYNPRGKKH